MEVGNSSSKVAAKVEDTRRSEAKRAADETAAKAETEAPAPKENPEFKAKNVDVEA